MLPGFGGLIIGNNNRELAAASAGGLFQNMMPVMSGISTTTLTDQNLGAEDAYRVIVVVLRSMADGVSPETVPTPTSVTIGGAAATITVDGSAANKTVFAAARVPTGTTGSIVFNWGTTITSSEITISVFRIVGDLNSLTPIRAYDLHNMTDASSAVAQVVFEHDGCALGISNWERTTNLTMTWTNMTEAFQGTVTNGTKTALMSAAVYNCTLGGLLYGAAGSYTSFGNFPAASSVALNSIHRANDTNLYYQSANVEVGNGTYSWEYVSWGFAPGSGQFGLTPPPTGGGQSAYTQQVYSDDGEGNITYMYEYYTSVENTSIVRQWVSYTSHPITMTCSSSDDHAYSISVWR